MARGSEIPGLNEAIRRAVKEKPGITSPGLRDYCEEQLGHYMSINTVNSAMKRLVKTGEYRQVRDKIPFRYYLTEEEK